MNAQHFYPRATIKAHPASPHRSRPYSRGISPGKLDYLTEPEKFFEHHCCVLRICWEKFNSFSFGSAVLIKTIRIDTFLFQGRLMQPEIEQIFGEFAVILQPIGSFTIAERLIEALGVMSQ